MSITVNIYYKGENGSARKFAEEICFTEVCPKMVASAVKILEDME